MAVYKATYCYPFLGSCDARVAPGETQWITCKVDSSNKKVTGYRITIYDENNNMIFPHYDPSSSDIYNKKDWNISPISELSYGGVLPKDDNGNLVMVEEDGKTKIKLPSQEYLTNSGMNGAYLNLPFFQNQNSRVTTSANAVYYQPRYQAEYLIRDIEEGAEGYKTPENSANWVLRNGRYYCNKDKKGQAPQIGFEFFTGKLNGDSKLRPYQTVLFYKTSDAGNVFFVGHLLYENDSWSIEKDYDVNESGEDNACVITRGLYHDCVYVADPVLREYTGDLWCDASGNKIPLSMGKAYKWVITLYQGDGAMTPYQKTAALMDYSNINVSEWYDMVLQKGQILGSCPSRIQIAKYDDSTKKYLLPRNKDGSSVVLYKTYAQLIAPSGRDVGSRFYVNSYSSSLGHVYPLESDANTITVEGASFVEFFKHSNNPEAILDTDMVDMASVKAHVYKYGDDRGNVELSGLQNIDGVIGENGKYVLVMYQKDPTENGVYKMTDDSSSTISMKVHVVTTDKNGNTTESDILKTYQRDSTKDKYTTDGIPYEFAWTHKKTEEESDQEFELTAYTISRYCKQGDSSWVGEEQKPAKIDSAKMVTWTRSGGYTSWSDYIGKVIYVSGGTVNGGKNFTSTAAAGGTLLKRPYTGTQDVSTPLYFVPERSVVLFPQLLNDDYSIKALGEFKSGGTTAADTVDGVTLSSGDYYIERSTGNIRLYTTLHDAGELIRTPGEDIKYYYINQGQTYGLQVCKIGNNRLMVANSKDLNRAEVLKNTTTKTYIGQYANLDTNMILRFDDKVVKTKDDSAHLKDYLKIKKVDQVVWSIEHEALASPFRSYSSGDGEPYYYKICTFYKKSDENPFYCREAPYLIINGGLADGYAKEGNHKRLSVYPWDGKIFGNTAVGYDLNIGGAFSGTPQNALARLSLAEDAAKFSPGTDGVSVVRQNETFNFPKFDNQIWEDDASAFSHDFGFKISDADKVVAMEQTIAEKYKSFTKEAIGLGEAGLKALQMPEVLRKAANEKWMISHTEGKESFLVVSYAPVFESGYKLSLNGLYKQGNGASWESYRWVLEKVRFDGTLSEEDISEGVEKGDLSLFDHIEESIVIKDTGNRYDKKINTVFYGLLDNLEESDISDVVVGVGGKTLFSNIYLVTLYVTDENGITKSEKRLFEYKAPSKVFSYCIKSFEATMDCQKECIRISVSPKFIDSSYRDSNNDDFLYLKEFSIFKREYKLLYRFNNGKIEHKVLIGNKWDPVVLSLKAAEDSSMIDLLDFNIKSGYSYQYVIFPGDYSTSMLRVPYIYANTGKTKDGTSIYDRGWRPFVSFLSKPVKGVLQYWSIVNLIPTQEDSQLGTGISTYVADTDNIWVFKYQLENGSLSQNISKNELSTLGKYPKIGIGRKNFLSGSVSCYLGSEIIPLSKVGYIERTPASRNVPMSTNEKAFMVERWRDFVATGTPKLLRDTKGQSWIVQIVDGTTTTNESISIKPDTISFSWRQIADTNDVIIYARQDQQEHQDQSEMSETCAGEWQEWRDDLKVKYERREPECE